LDRPSQETGKAFRYRHSGCIPWNQPDSGRYGRVQPEALSHYLPVRAGLDSLLLQYQDFARSIFIPKSNTVVADMAAQGLRLMLVEAGGKHRVHNLTVAFWILDMVFDTI